MSSSELINKAKDYLEHQPVDSVHSVDHHERVADNCMKIIEEEHLNINSYAVVIAAWWHDVETKQGATTLLQQEMEMAGFDRQTIESVSAIVRSHTFGKDQKTIESQVLFDADKMEYFNPERMRKAVKDAQEGTLSIPILAQHYHLWLDRYQSVLSSFHFSYSRETAFRNLVETLKEIEKMRIFLETYNIEG